MGPFNNREIAATFWLLAVAVWAFQKPGIRKTVGAAFRAFCHYKIIGSVALMLMYVVGVIAGFRGIGIWDAGLLDALS